MTLRAVVWWRQEYTNTVRIKTYRCAGIWTRETAGDRTHSQRHVLALVQARLRLPIACWGFDPTRSQARWCQYALNLARLVGKYWRVCVQTFCLFLNYRA